MLPEVKRFLDNCKKIDRIVNVTVEDAQELHLDHIADAYAFDDHPQLFKFTILCDAGEERAVNIVVPIEILQKFDSPPMDELIAAANRHTVVDLTAKTYFLRPDVLDSVCFRGHEINPMQDIPEPLANILARIRQIPTVESAEVYRVVDPVIHDMANCSNAVIINCAISNVPYKDIIRAGTDLRSDSYQTTLPERAYMDPEHLEGIIQSTTEAINNLNK
jgi:hypothetical protein